MKPILGIVACFLLPQLGGCGGASWTPPASLPRVPSIPQRVTPNPSFLQSLRVSIERVLVQPETLEDEESEREEAAEEAQENPNAPPKETELAVEWREGVLAALAKHRLSVVPQGGARLTFDVRRPRGRNFICDITAVPIVGHPWKKRYIVDARDEEADMEAGPAIVVADLLQDPEFFAAIQGWPLPPNTGVFLSQSPNMPQR